MLAPGQVVRVPAGNVRMLPISNNRYRKPAAFDNLPGIVVVSTLLGDIEMSDVSGWIAVGQGLLKV